MKAELQYIDGTEMAAMVQAGHKFADITYAIACMGMVGELDGAIVMLEDAGSQAAADVLRDLMEFRS